MKRSLCYVRPADLCPTGPGYLDKLALRPTGFTPGNFRTSSKMSINMVQSSRGNSSLSCMFRPMVVDQNRLSRIILVRLRH